MENLRKIFSKLFNEHTLEENFQCYIKQTQNNLIYLIMLIYFLSNCSLLIYCCFMTSKIIFIILLGISIGINLVLMLVYLKLNSVFIKSIFELCCYFLLWISLIIILFLMINEEENILESKITRIISFIIIFKNISLVLWSRISYFIWFFFSLINIGIIITYIVLSENSEFEDIVIEMITCLICFGIKKYYDTALRSTFSEMNKFQNEKENQKNLINSMSGLHITFSGNKLIAMNDNVKSLLLKMETKKNLTSNFILF